MASSISSSRGAGPRAPCEGGRGAPGRGRGLPSVRKVDQKLRRLQRIEASYRTAIKRALEQSKLDTVDPVKAKARFEKAREKYERKIHRLMPKIKALTDLRAELKGDRGAKGQVAAR